MSQTKHINYESGRTSQEEMEQDLINDIVMHLNVLQSEGYPDAETAAKRIVTDLRRCNLCLDESHLNPSQ